VIAVGCKVGAGRGWAGLTPAQELDLSALVRERTAGGRRATLVWFGSPQVLPVELVRHASLSVLFAFAPSAPMQEAAARWLAGEIEARGRLPVRLQGAEQSPLR
jgi:hypothetical protein